MRIAILTANTEIYREQEEDKAGKVIREIVEAAGHQVVFAKALPLDKKVLSTIMQRMADGQMADLILTTGGAGLAQGDCTPEATLEVVDREIRGIPEAMRAHMMTLTKRSMLNRAAAGVRNNVMIVNLPGKAGAVKECLEYLLPEIIHGVEVIKGEVQERQYACKYLYRRSGKRESGRTGRLWNSIGVCGFQRGASYKRTFTRI